VARTDGVKKGWSFARLLVITAIVGVVGGSLLGSMGKDEDPIVVAEREVARAMPRGVPLDTGDPMEPDPASLSGIPPYPGVYPRRLGRGTAGGPMSIAWFSTQDSTEAVLRYYEKAFRADGRHPVSHRRGPDMGYVAWLDRHNDGGLANGVLHMISVMKQYDQTIVLVSASRPDMLMNSMTQVPGGFSLPPNSSEPQVIEMGESAIASQVVYARANDQTPGDVVKFFAQQFKDRGFEVTVEKEVDGQAGVSGKKGPLNVVVAARSEGGNSSIVMTYDRQPEAVAP